MDKETIDNWQRVKEGLESAGKTDCHFYTRACAIVAGNPDPLDPPEKLEQSGIYLLINMAKRRMAGDRLSKENLTPNKPKRTPNHPKKSHVVLAKEGGKEKLIRFGEQGASTAGKPKDGESDKMKKKRASFKARHGKNIKKGRMSAAYWADKVKW